MLSTYTINLNLLLPTRTLEISCRYGYLAIPVIVTFCYSLFGCSYCLHMIRLKSILFVFTRHACVPLYVCFTIVSIILSLVYLYFFMIVTHSPISLVVLHCRSSVFFIGEGQTVIAHFHITGNSHRTSCRAFHSSSHTLSDSYLALTLCHLLMSHVAS